MKKTQITVLIYLFTLIIANSGLAQMQTYQMRIRNNHNFDVYDLYFELRDADTTFWFPGSKHKIRMITNAGSSDPGKLWRRGKSFRGNGASRSNAHALPMANTIDFNLGGPVAVKPNTIAEFVISYYRPRKEGYSPNDQTLKGFYFWTTDKGKSVGGVSYVNRRSHPNWNIETFHINTTPKPAKKISTAGCSLNNKDTVSYVMMAQLMKKEELISLGYFEGMIPPGDSIEHEITTNDEELGDSLFTIWNFENIRTGETWMVDVRSEVIKGTIFSPGDTVNWSQGENSQGAISYLGGEGVEVRCQQLPGFIATDTTQEFVSEEFGFPENLSDQPYFPMNFTRTGRGAPSGQGSTTGGTEETVSFIVHHADFRPTASWTTGDGHFDDRNNTITFPVTVSRQVADDDWVYCEFLSSQLADTIWFHKEITGTSASFELPVEFTDGFLERVDSIQLKVKALSAPSSPDTLTIYVSHSQGIDQLNEIPLQVLCYPNPVQKVVSFSFDLDEPGPIELVVLDIQGRQVAELAKGYFQNGKQHITWDLEEVPVGVYFYRLTVANQRISGRFSKQTP